MEQVSERQRGVWEKQGYRIIGNHSAVKVCHWTKSMLRREGGCYKFKFYGIRSHQCMQMTTSMACANRCSFCWRGEKAPVSQDWYGSVDDPLQIIDGSIKKHVDLLMGFKGSPSASPVLVEQMKNVRHVAMSLTGEPITYPRMNELCAEFHRRGISTFVVTNGQFPDAIKNLHCVTQLIVSVDAPDKELLKKIDRPLFKDYYERLLACLDELSKKPFRKALRLTVIKGVNDVNLEGYKQLIERGMPDFFMVKGYMFVGASKKMMSPKNVPVHDEVVAFCKELAVILPDYEIADEHRQSRVVLFMRKSLYKKKFINFPAFYEAVNNGRIPTTEEYSSVNMQPNVMYAEMKEREY